MVYADMSYYTAEREDLERAIHHWNECFGRAGMKLNVSKTEILCVSREKEDNFNIVINGETVKNVEKAKYLGSVIMREGGNKLDITERIGKFSKNVGALYPILKDKHVPQKTKQIIFETVLSPTLMYGTEAWAITTTDWSRIQASEMRPLRTIANKTRLDKNKK